MLPMLPGSAGTARKIMEIYKIMELPSPHNDQAIAIRRRQRAILAEDRRLVEGVREHLTELRRRYPAASASSDPMIKLVDKLRKAFDDVDAHVEEDEMQLGAIEARQPIDGD